MLYSEFIELRLSKFDFGAMRLPLLAGGFPVDIDEKATAEMIQLAFDAGVNYFDTARPYHLGASEEILGRLLRKYPRDSYYFATKFPGYDVSPFHSLRKVFAEQLVKTVMEYFDFYLLHNVCDLDIKQYLENAPEMIAFLKEQKVAGIIHHIGFSIHGSQNVLERFLDVTVKLLNSVRFS